MRAILPFGVDVLVDRWEDNLNIVRPETTSAAGHWTYAFLEQERRIDELAVQSMSGNMKLVIILRSPFLLPSKPRQSPLLNCCLPNLIVEFIYRKIVLAPSEFLAVDPLVEHPRALLHVRCSSFKSAKPGGP